MESQFKVMNVLFDFTELGLEDIYYLPDNIKLFGDNYSDDFAGFDILSNKDEVMSFGTIQMSFTIQEKYLESISERKC
jgi:hypothetical protein